MNRQADSFSQLQSDDTDLLGIFGMMRRRMGLIILGLVIGTALAVAYFLLTPPTYQAKMEILVGQKSGDLVKGASSKSSVEGSDTEEDILSTHIQLMTSRRIVASAIENHDLINIKSVEKAVEDDGNALDYILDHLEVGKGGDGVARDAHTLRATYDDPSPEDCAVILRAIYDEYELYLEQLFEGTSSQAVELLTELSEKNYREVEVAEAAFAEHLAMNNLMWDGEQTRNVHKDRLAKIEESMLELTEQEAETASRLAVIQDFLENTPEDEVTDFDRLALLSEKEVARLSLMFQVTRGDIASEAFQAELPIRQETARAEYDEYLQLVMKEKKLRERFSDGHPQVVSIREQIQLMRKFIDENSAKVSAQVTRERMHPAEMLKTYVSLLTHDLAGIKKRREVLAERSTQELKLAKNLEQAELRAASMRKEVDRRQDLLKDAQDTLDELNFVRDYAGFSTEVIGDAETQSKASWPRPLIVLALGMFAGGLLGFGSALVADLMDTTFVDPDDVQEALGAPVLAHVPRFVPMRRGRKDPPLEIDSSVRVYHQPRSPAAEVFRVMRTGLLVDAKTTGHQVFQITSPLPGDGKSTTSVNLAMAFAQAGKRTLIIDADLRKPRVGRLLHLDADRGLSEVLHGDCEPADAIYETPNKNLFAVPSGAIPANPSELLQSELFAQVLNLWRDQFDFVIVDTPPVLAVSDAAVVSEETDAVVMTVRILKNGRRAAMRARDVLNQNHASITAIVVNGYQTKASTYGYRGGYDSDAYGYGYGETNKDYYRDSENASRPLETVS